MKQILLLVLAALFSWASSQAQDVITTKSGENIQAKVVEVGVKEIKYKMANNPDGPLYTIPKSDVIMTRYENGTVELYKTEKKAEEPETTIPATENMYLKGQVDAARYYKKYSGSGTGTLIASLISPLVGLIPAVACSSTMPKKENLNYPNEQLMTNADYYLGYTQKAKKMKQGRVWLNWGIGLGVNIVAEAVLMMSHK